MHHACNAALSWWRSLILALLILALLWNRSLVLLSKVFSDAVCVLGGGQQAFGEKGVVYFGGSDDQKEKGVMIHGLCPCLLCSLAYVPVAVQLEEGSLLHTCNEMCID